MTQPSRSSVAGGGWNRGQRQLWTIARLNDNSTRQPSGCLVWKGAAVRDKYGYVWHDGDHWLTHRLAYTLAVGPIPDGLHIDHLCFVTRCIEPTHLEAVTNEENSRRREAHWWANDPRCPKGHRYLEGDNARRDPKGWLHCRQCERDWSARRKAARARVREEAA